MDNWISVDDRLPEKDMCVDIWADGERLTDMVFVDGGFNQPDLEWLLVDAMTTHWMKIPSPPETK